MNRNDFMKQLESLLQNVSPTEREEALQYYNDYFDDAGAENEKEVIEALGNPARVAENIKRDLAGNSESDRAKASDRALVEYGKTVGDAKSQTKEKPRQSSKESMPTWQVVLLVILLIFASPVILGVGGGLLGVLAGVIASWFALIFGFGVTALALFVVLIVCLVVGAMCMVIDPMAGVGVMGCGLLCGGIGLLFLMLSVAMGGVATPAICKGIAGLFHKRSSEGKEKGVL